MLNSQNGRLITTGKYNDFRIENYIQPIYPGGEPSFDINEQVLIEFSHLDGFNWWTSEFTDTTNLALDQIQISDTFTKGYQL